MMWRKADELRTQTHLYLNPRWNLVAALANGRALDEYPFLHLSSGEPNSYLRGRWGELRELIPLKSGMMRGLMWLPFLLTFLHFIREKKMKMFLL